MCDEQPTPQIDATPILERRNILRVFLTSVMSVLLFPVKTVQAKKLAVGLDKAEKLKQVGGWAILKVKDQEVLFVRDGEKSIRALDPMCTHKKCKVKYTPEDGQLHCPCHKSAYEVATGKVLDGPAPKPLTVFPASLENDKIIFSLPDNPS